jgi:hypothetical protein
VWHDTAGNRSKTIPLFKGTKDLNALFVNTTQYSKNVNHCFGFSIADPHTSLDYASFWNVRTAFPPYEIPEQPASTIRQLQESLDFCKERIMRTRPLQVNALFLFLFSRLL